LTADPLLTALDLTRAALQEHSDARWIVAFSGGKDSTATLKILCAALRKAAPRPQSISVIYCDTGVENPVLDQYVRRLFARLQKEFDGDGTGIRCRLLRAPVRNRFFVKIIGRGYPPPTNTFRWCTKNLRILPVSTFIKASASANTVVVLGSRRNESEQRNRSLERNGGAHWQVQEEGPTRYKLFLPILDLTVQQVWDAIFMLDSVKSVDAAALEQLYSGASAGECPVLKAPQAAPCATGRFGCWTCTVVRKDKSLMNLIKTGHPELQPFHDFRNWLAQVRNDPARRWKRRRNGSLGLGAFTLAARKEILHNLRRLETVVSDELVSPAELREIRRLWALDRHIDKRMSAGN